MSVTIQSVDAGSPAARAHIAAGETLLTINGHPIRDVLDYRFRETERTVVLELESRDGCRRTVTIHKDEYAALGLEFETYLMDRQRSCRNKCVFCFIDQLPGGLRESLYFKDDDERLSFLFGNYITLTNLTDEELVRIVEMHISPVNVSVHTTNPELRVKMMANPHAADVMERLRVLADGGIKLNCQLVLCPGWNDGDELLRSLDELLALAPAIQSIALVPVGLTKHREGLAQLRLFTRREAADTVAVAERYAAENKKKYGMQIVWAADEFYIAAGLELPPASRYEDYPQLENGVGLVSLLREEFARAAEDAEPDELPHAATIATGVSAAPVLERMLREQGGKWPNADWEVVPIRNEFFGESITVAGLVTGGDLIKQLSGREIKGGRLLIPSVMLRHEGDLFLDSLSVGDVASALKAEITTVDNDGYELLDRLLDK